MLCPYCQTENRDDREDCYHCSKDISMLRLIVNKAKHHYNQALEHAERGRTDEAITELKNALELDSTMVSAYVVLGTLYAQQEKVDDAQKAWKQALALDHRYEKVHDYLNKSEPAKVAFPAIRRLRTLAGLLGVGVIALACVLGIVTLGQTGPSGDALTRELGNTNLESATARNKLEEFTRQRGVDPEALQFAQTLQKSIEQGWQEKLDLARTALGQNSPALALQIVDGLEKRKPDANVLGSIRRTRQLATQQLLDRLGQAAAEFDKGSRAFEQVKPEALAVIAALPDSPEREQAQKLLDQMQARYNERVLAEASKTLAEAPIHDAIRQYALWRANETGLADQLTKLIDARLENETVRLGAEVAELTEKGEVADAEARLKVIGALYTEAGRPQPDARVAELSQAIAAAQAQARLTAVAKAYEGKQWEAFLAATENLDTLTSDAVERAKFTAQRERAWREFVREQWDWLEARDARFDNNSISTDDAARTIKLYPVLLEHLPKDLKYARAGILFYAASAHLRLGQKAEAAALLERAQTENPKQYGAKEARAFAKRFADKLK